MGDVTVRCHDCDARLKVPDDRATVRCPKCKATVRVPSPDDDEDEDERPARRPARRDDPDDDDRPRARRRREEDDEDDRPRRKKKRRAEADDGQGPWLIAAAGAFVAFALTFGLTLAINGRVGLAPGQDGPTQKLIGLGIGFVVALVLIPLGVFGVRDKVAYGRWHEVTGTTAVVLGFVQSIGGGLIAGFTLYGLIFAIINGH